jgi:protein SCO1
VFEGTEDTERKKDEAALKWFIKFGGAAGFLCGAAYFGNMYAKKRYGMEEGSVRVNVTTRGKPSLGGPFTLVNTDGVPMSQAEFLGKWCFFYFGFTHCPEICPIELNRMSHVVDAVKQVRPHAQMAPLFVSCDPNRDSLDSIKEYVSEFHPDFVGLVGTPSQVNETCKSYRIYYSVPDEQTADSQDYLIDHSIAIFLFDPYGRFVDFFGTRYTEDEITQKVISYIDNVDADPTWTNW